MGKKKIQMAIAYDFDGTLAPGNMQEYNFIPALDLKPKPFWKEVKQIAREHNADEVLVYMGLMLEKAQQKQLRVRRANFKELGLRTGRSPFLRGARRCGADHLLSKSAT